MKVTEKKIEDGLIELTAAAATAEVAQAFNVAHYSFCASMGVEVPQGQTPAQAAEEKLGIKDLDSVSQQMAIDYLVPFATCARRSRLRPSSTSPSSAARSSSSRCR